MHLFFLEEKGESISSDLVPSESKRCERPCCLVAFLVFVYPSDVKGGKASDFSVSAAFHHPRPSPTTSFFPRFLLFPPRYLAKWKKKGKKGSSPKKCLPGTYWSTLHSETHVEHQVFYIIWTPVEHSTKEIDEITTFLPDSTGRGCWIDQPAGIKIGHRSDTCCNSHSDSSEGGHFIECRGRKMFRTGVPPTICDGRGEWKKSPPFFCYHSRKWKARRGMKAKKTREDFKVEGSDSGQQIFYPRNDDPLI